MVDKQKKNLKSCQDEVLGKKKKKIKTKKKM